MKRICTLLLIAPLFSGCIAQMVMDSQDRQHYLDYRSSAERINLEREKANLQPESIMPYDEWKNAK